MLKPPQPDQPSRNLPLAALALMLLATALLGAGCGGVDDEPVGAEGRAVKIICDERGVYRITGRDLAELGYDPDTIATSRLALAHLDQSVPLLIEGAGRRLGPDGEIIFFSEGRENLPVPFVNMEREYYPPSQHLMLHLDSAPVQPRRYETVALETPARHDPHGWPVVTVGGRSHFEQDPIWGFFPLLRLEEDPTDFVFWQRLSYPPTSESPSQATMEFYLPEIERAEPVQMELLMVARTVMGDSPHSAWHNMAVELNGQPIEKFSWGTDRERLRLTVPANVLRKGANWLTLDLLEPGREGAPPTPGLKIDMIYLDWFRVHFRQRTEIRGGLNEFLFAGAAGRIGEPPAEDQPPAGEGPLRLSIRQFANDAILLLEPEQGLRYQAPPFEQGSGSRYRAVNVELPRRPTWLLALTREELRRPFEMQPTRIAGHFEQPSSAELLVLAPTQFIEPLGRLVEWKRQRGLEVALVDVREIFNERASGYPGPAPLRDYIRHVYESQDPPRLRYVMLVGDANSIHKEVTQMPAWSFVHSGQPANDNYFASLEGPADAPALAVGRLSARTPEELNTAIDKIIAYENGEGRGPWRGRFLMIAASHTWARNHSLSLIGKHLAARYLIDYMQTDLVRSDAAYHQEINGRLVGHLNEGNLLTAFFGHGGGAVWEIGPTAIAGGFVRHLFDQAHVTALNNHRALPLVFALTCYTNDFDSPHWPQTLGESFVISKGGAIGVIGANTRSFTELNLRFTDKFLGLLHERGHARLGDLFVEVKKSLASGSANSQYQLLGDPSLEFELPREDLAIENLALDAAAGKLSLDYALPAEAGPLWNLEGFVLDSHHKVLAHWRQPNTPARGRVEQQLKLAPNALPVRLVIYMERLGEPDRIAGRPLEWPRVAAAAQPAPQEGN